MIDYKELIDITYIEHPSNEAYRQEYLESFRGEFVPRAMKGIDGSLEFGRRACIDSCEKKYIMLNDADDIYSSEVIKRAIDFLEADKENKYIAVAAKEGTFHKTHTEHTWSKNLNEFDITPDMLQRNLFYMHNFVVYRASALMESVKDFTTTESNYDYAFKKNFLYGDKLARSLGEVGMLFRIRNDGKNWSGINKSILKKHKK